MQLCGKAHDPDFWKQVREKDCYAQIIGIMKKWWSETCEKPIEELRYQDFKLYFETGDRVTFENAYFARRRALNASAMLSLIYPEEPKYLDCLQEIIFAICTEYTWCLPAHLRPAALEDHDPDRVDLFASETAMELAEISVLLHSRLDPFLVGLVKQQTKRRVVDHFAQHPETWEKSANNWAAVCTAGIGCTIMHLFPERMGEFLPRFDRAMEKFLSGFSKEGVCLEGVDYWNYGFGFFTVYADMLRTFTNGKRNYFAREDVKNAASFFQKTFLSDSAGIPFADVDNRCCQYYLGLCCRLRHYFPQDVVLYRPEYANSCDPCARWCINLREITWLDESITGAENESYESMEFFAPNAGWFLKRGNCYGFAAKGGHNKELHNHNDVGAFAFLKNGRQIICDPGRGEYTRQYFRPEYRYDIVECSSRGHSVPILGGNFQKFGPEFCAKEMTWENGVFSLDIAGAYGLSELRSLKRSFAFTEASVTLRDFIDYDGEIVERFVSFEKPRVNGNTVTIGEGKLTFCESQTSVVRISSEPNTTDGVLWFTDFTLTGKEFTLTMQ